MSDAKDVLPINALVGMPVLSLSSGNKLGQVRDLFVDPINGILTGLTIANAAGENAGLAYDEIYSFGQDAIMARSDASVRNISELFPDHPSARDLIGTKIITESGNLIGHIADIYITVSPPPLIIYEIRESLLDKLLGRQLFIPASAGHALSDDSRRLVVPDETIDIATPSIATLVEQRISVRSFDASGRPVSDGEDDRTFVPGRDADDETIVRGRDDGEITVVHPTDDDETVLRLRPARGS